MKGLNKDGSLPKSTDKYLFRIRSIDALQLVSNKNPEKIHTKYDHIVFHSLDLTQLKKCMLDYWDDLCEKKPTNEKKNILNSDVLICVNLSNLMKKCKPTSFKKKPKRGYALDLIHLYTEGFVIEGKRYMEYKRSASQAKDGKHLFIITEDINKGIKYNIRNQMMAWNWMGISFKDNDNVNWTDIKAYESLVNSTLEENKTIRSIKPKNMLLVDDLVYSYKAKDYGDIVCLLKEKDETYTLKKRTTVPDKNKDKTEYTYIETESTRKVLSVDRYSEDVSNFTVENMVFDGECLVDDSIFSNNDSHGMILLRNRFFKSCGFRTRIQDYYKEHLDDFENAILYDMFGNARKAKDIKMIFTPSSLKFFKFSEQVKSFLEDSGIKVENANSAAYTYWLDHLEMFGVVKQESAGEDKDDFWPGNKDDIYHTMSYQMINSLPLTPDEISPFNDSNASTTQKNNQPISDYLLKPDFEYWRLLKTDDNAFMRYVGYDKIYISSSLVAYLSSRNPGFLKTELGKRNRRFRLTSYQNNLKKGLIQVEGDYYVLCSMPLELLQWSIWGQNSNITKHEPQKRTPSFNSKSFINHTNNAPSLNREQVYIQGMAPGIEITLFRNPHTSPSNIACAVTTEQEDLDKYFIFNNNGKCNIAVICPAKWDIMETLSGADFDSDTVLITTNPIINAAARKVKIANKHMFPVPHLSLEKSKIPMTPFHDKRHLVWLDHILSRNNIGKSSNLAQTLLSWYWAIIVNNPNALLSMELEEFYNQIIIASTLSSIEIDRAKHSFSIETDNVIKSMYDHGYRLSKPVFMQYLKKGKKIYEDNSPWCPMNHVYYSVSKISDTIGKMDNTRQSTLSYDKIFKIDLTDSSIDYENKLPKAIIQYLTDCSPELFRKSLRDAKKDEKKQLIEQHRELTEKYVKKFRRLSVTPNELKRLLRVVLCPNKDALDYCQRHMLESICTLFFLDEKAFIQCLHKCMEARYQENNRKFENEYDAEMFEEILKLDMNQKNPGTNDQGNHFVDSLYHYLRSVEYNHNTYYAYVKEYYKLWHEVKIKDLKFDNAKGWSEKIKEIILNVFYNEWKKADVSVPKKEEIKITKEIIYTFYHIKQPRYREIKQEKILNNAKRIADLTWNELFQKKNGNIKKRHHINPKTMLSLLRYFTDIQESSINTWVLQDNPIDVLSILYKAYGEKLFDQVVIKTTQT